MPSSGQTVYWCKVIYGVMCFLFQLTTDVDKSHFHQNSSKSSNKSEDTVDDNYDVMSTLANYVESTSRRIQMNPEEMDSAYKILDKTFNMYEEDWDTRFLDFYRHSAHVTISNMVKEYKWDSEFGETLIDTINEQQPTDYRTKERFRIVNGGLNNFRIFYLIIHIKGDYVKMGIAHGRVEFEFKPELIINKKEIPVLMERGGWFSNDKWRMLEIETGREYQEKNINLKEKEILEKFLIKKALDKFANKLDIIKRESLDAEPAYSRIDEFVDDI